MHFRIQSQIFGVIICIEFYGKCITVSIFIGFQCKGGQWKQVNAVAILQGCQVAISGRHPYHIGDTGQASGRCTHPHHVMVPPLYIYRMVLA